MRCLLLCALLCVIGCSTAPDAEFNEPDMPDQNVDVTINTDPLCQVEGTALPICTTGERAPDGDLSVLLGMSIQEPTRTDMDGALIDESSVGERWMNLPRDSFRFPAGTDSYSISGRSDPKLVYFFDTFLPKYRGVKNDQTWGPQIPIDDFAMWIHDDLRRITLGNEPPIHPDYFENGDAYVEWAKSVIAQYPEFADQFWIQSGKPEFIELELVAPNGILRHRDLLEKAGVAVRAGDLPSRIVTTHKLFNEQYPDDRLTFYRELLDDYRSAFNDDVKLCFQEVKLGRGESVSFDAVARFAEFSLILSRLRFEEGDIINGTTYQQGFASGTINLIGLDDPATPEWTETALTDLWERFGTVFQNGTYLETDRPNETPATVQIELFEVNGGLRLLYSNYSAQDVRVASVGGTIWFVDELLNSTERDFDGSLPARSVGVVRID